MNAMFYTRASTTIFEKSRFWYEGFTAYIGVLVTVAVIYDVDVHVRSFIFKFHCSKSPHIRDLPK